MARRKVAQEHEHEQDTQIPDAAERVINYAIDRQFCSLEQAYATIESLLRNGSPLDGRPLTGAHFGWWIRSFHVANHRLHGFAASKEYWKVRVRTSHHGSACVQFEVTRMRPARGATWRSSITGGGA